MDEHRVQIAELPLRVRPARRERAFHALRDRPIAARIVFVIDKAADSTHRLFLLKTLVFHPFYAGMRPDMRPNARMDDYKTETETAN
ncbi:hypothetical protein AGATL06_21660 [Agathobaculum sp. TL06]